MIGSKVCRQLFVVGCDASRFVKFKPCVQIGNFSKLHPICLSTQQSVFIANFSQFRGFMLKNCHVQHVAAQTWRGSQTDSAENKPIIDRIKNSFNPKIDHFVKDEKRPMSDRSSGEIPPRLSDYDPTKPDPPPPRVGFFASLATSPRPAFALALAGAIPFIAAPMFLVYLGHFDQFVANSQIFYGATIVSFLGGIRWGHSLLPGPNPADGPSWSNLGLSVVPQLLAWTGLMCPFPVSIGLVAGALFVATHFDLRHSTYPHWFKTLRLLLSAIVMFSLWTTFVLGFSMPLMLKKTLDRQKAKQFDTEQHVKVHTKNKDEGV